MASKVEELQDKLYGNARTNIEQLASAWGTGEYLAEKEIRQVAFDLDSLISSAHAEGVAKGREQERVKIRMTARTGIGVADGIDYVLVPVSVLAPTKEVAG